MKLATLSQTTSASATPRVIECTINDLQLKRVDLNAVNLANNKPVEAVDDEGKTYSYVPPVFMTLTYQDDSTEKVWCSANVSKGIREQTIKPENFGVLCISKQYTKRDHKPFWQVQMPDGVQGVNTITIDGAKIGVKPIERKIVSWTELYSSSNA